MKKIFVDPFTFEVARTLYRGLPGRVGGNCGQTEQRALVAIIFALNDSGFLISEHSRRETWFCFGPEAKDLDHFGDVSDERLEGLTAHTIGFKLRRSELSRSAELSERYRADFDVGVVKNAWRGVGTIIDRVLKGELRLIGPEVQDGLIIQDLIRSTPKEGHYLWFSLDKASKMPSLVDLESPVLFEGQPLRIPLKAAASERGRKFVTLGPPMIGAR
ncbi:hypothetical protein [Bradyrhizobium sp. 187]|uniref:hypothetical protein n=1 Tax=Bradyrhizobium sp. 187 TaxID=2782655 RepID=UPI001FFE419E|nr:hypothetical protein [Bradyrhizobium sp. 187]UPJ74099.1 hypothetical protein IVB19_05900 [Bradyrhizobium sp. 187]